MAKILDTKNGEVEDVDRKELDEDEEDDET